DNNAGCKATKIIALGEASGPSTTAAITAPLCGSNSNGAITLTPAAATYRYAWSNGSASRDQMGLKPGRYSVRITDTVTGCTQVYAYVLDARPQIELAATPSSNTSCASAATGEIQLDVKGGTPPLTYAWSHGPSTQHVSGLNAGTYSVLVSDAQGCTQSLSVPIRTDSSKLMKLSLGTITAASCNTSANGSAQVTVTG